MEQKKDWKNVQMYLYAQVNLWRKKWHKVVLTQKN